MERQFPRRTARFVIALALALTAAVPVLAQICDEPPPEPVKPTTSTTGDESSKPQA